MLKRTNISEVKSPKATKIAGVVSFITFPDSFVLKDKTGKVTVKAPKGFTITKDLFLVRVEAIGFLNTFDQFEADEIQVILPK